MNHKIDTILAAYIKKLDSLQYSLPIVMNSMGDELEKESSKFDKFITERALKIEDAEDSKAKKYTIPIEYSKEFERQKLKIEHMALAFNLLPKNFLVSYVSQYDSFLGDLIKELLLSKPDLFNNSDRELKFKDLLEFDTITDARDYILEKEVETLLRKSHNEQFEWMTSKFNVPLTKNLSIWKDFIEITERRNLFVHNNGTISNQYIKVCKEHKVNLDGILLGGLIDVNPAYLTESYEVFYEIGFKLAHVLWRKLLPEDLEAADMSLIESTYELLAHKKYKLAQILLDFTSETLKKYHSDVNRRVLVINRAIAYKFDGEKEKCVSILGKDDWSATGMNFQLAIAILHENDESVYKLMKSVGKESREMPAHIYSEWPLFEEYREKEEFQDTYKEIFEKDLEIIERVF